MPSARYPDPQSLKAQLLNRVREGEWPSRVCGRDGMPSWACFKVWARADPAFAAQLADAQIGGRGVRSSDYDGAVVDAFLARVAAGEPINGLLARAGMPSQRQYREWRRGMGFLQGGFDRLAAARAAGKAARAARRGGPDGRFRRYDAAVAEAIYVRAWMGEGLRAILRSEARFPAQTVLARWRREQPEFDAMLRTVFRAWRVRGRPRVDGWSEGVAQAVTAALLEGASLRAVARRPDMPCTATLYNWMRRRPEFDAAVSRACEDREDWVQDVMEAALDAGDLAGARRVGGAAGRMRRRGRSSE